MLCSKIKSLTKIAPYESFSGLIWRALGLIPLLFFTCCECTIHKKNPSLNSFCLYFWNTNQSLCLVFWIDFKSFVWKTPCIVYIAISLFLVFFLTKKVNSFASNCFFLFKQKKIALSNFSFSIQKYEMHALKFSLQNRRKCVVGQKKREISKKSLC